MSPRIRYLWYVCGILCAALVLTLGITNGIVLLSDSRVYHYIEEVPTTTVAVVLGGGMKDDNTMSDFQIDRVLQAIALYHAGKVERILLSGDDGALRDNEVDSMQALALETGVPSSSIMIDRHAYRTYLTCYRAKHEFGIEQMVVVTNGFHLPRTLYLCRGMGIDTVGLSADLRTSYVHGLKANIREIFARVKAVIQLKITKPMD